MEGRRVSGGYMPLRDAIDQLFAESVITPSRGGFPPADVYVTDDDVVLELAAPGVDPNDINISVTGDTVTVSGELRHQHESQKGRALLTEIARGQFQRTFPLPIEVDANKAEATYDGGILTLTLPKSEATRPRRIQVKPGQQTIQGQNG
jgi:HSP20 family protein